MSHTWLSEQAADAIVSAALAAHPDETGGILVGVRAGGHPWVTHAEEIPSGSRGPAHYTVPQGVTCQVVDRLRASDGRVGYLGEWHVHPVNCGPSPTDFSTLAELARDHSAGCSRPLLIVARRLTGAVAYRLEAFEWCGTSARPRSLVAAGPLQAPQAATG